MKDIFGASKIVLDDTVICAFSTISYIKPDNKLYWDFEIIL